MITDNDSSIIADIWEPGFKNLYLRELLFKTINCEEDTQFKTLAWSQAVWKNTAWRKTHYFSGFLSP